MKLKHLALSGMLLSSSLIGISFANAPQKGTVTKAAAEKAVKQALPNGKILSGEYEKESGHEIWSFDVRDGRALKEIWVDAHSGVVISNQTEGKADQKLENRMDKAEAMVKARTHGEVIGSTDNGKGKNEVYDFEVQKRDGTTQHVKVSARTMKVIK